MLVKTLLDLGADPNQKSGIRVSPRDLERMGDAPLEGGICSSAVTKLVLSRSADPTLMVRGKPLYPYERALWNKFESDISHNAANQTP